MVAVIFRFHIYTVKKRAFGSQANKNRRASSYDQLGYVGIFILPRE